MKPDSGMNIPTTTIHEPLAQAMYWSMAIVYGWHAFAAMIAFRPARGYLRILGMVPGVSYWVVYMRSLRVELVPFGAIMGLLLLGVSLGLYEWARWSIRGKFFSYAMSSDTPRFLHTSGPFAYLRNPFYLSYWIGLVAALMAFPTAVTAATIVVMFFYYQQVARFEERKFARSALSADYAVYKARTGRFFPRFSRSHG